MAGGAHGVEPCSRVLQSSRVENCARDGRQLSGGALACCLWRPAADTRCACVRERRADWTVFQNAEAQRRSV